MDSRWISLLGLVTMLALAYGFSTNRSAVKPRTVIWGVGLQFLLGVTILSEEKLHSFIGMFILAFLVVLYIFEDALGARFSHLGNKAPWIVGAGTLVGAALAVWLFREVAQRSPVVLWLIALAVIVLFASVRWRKAHLAGPALALVLLMIVGELWARDIHGGDAFRTVSEGVGTFLELSDNGAKFMFGNLGDRGLFFTGEDAAWPGFGFQFAFVVLPTIIFFSAFMSVLYYLGVVQVIVTAMARFMRWSLGTSGAETVSCSANIFIGQTEAPFLIKPFIKEMTLSEVHAIMVGGFATVAGGVLAGYIGMGVSPGHLIAASVMSAPASLVLAKLLLPETEESKTLGEVEMPEIEVGDNMVEAAAAGTTDGLKLALNVGAMLIAFISLIAVVDLALSHLDRLIDGAILGGTAVVEGGPIPGIFPDSLKTFFGTILRPLAFLMGVPWEDAAAVGYLLGIKLTVTEFVAYQVLADYIASGEIGQRAIIIATYALCGFANFSSIGIQIGGISSLVPERRKDLAKVAVRAMMGGALASWTTATIAGILITG